MKIAKIHIDLEDFGKALMNIKLSIKFIKGAEDPMLLDKAESILSEIKKNLH